jgi:hypothetical protein
MKVNRRTTQRADYLQNAYTKGSKCEKDHSMSRLDFCSTLSYHHGMWYKYHSHDAVTRIVARILRHRLPALRYRSPCPALTKILLKRSQEEQNITQPTQEKNPSLLKTTSVQIPVDRIKTLSQPATRNAANRAGINRRLDLEVADHSNDVSGRTSPTFTGDDNSSEDTDNDDSPGKNVLHFSHNDPTNPYCFSTLRKTAIVLTGMLIVINSTMGSSISSGISSEMTDYFGITSKSQLVLPTSIYLVVRSGTSRLQSSLCNFRPEDSDDLLHSFHSRVCSRSHSSS